jgi:hypothetical protein
MNKWLRLLQYNQYEINKIEKDPNSSCDKKVESQPLKIKNLILLLREIEIEWCRFSVEKLSW